MTTAIGLHIRSSLLGGLVTSNQLETTLNSDGLYIDGFLSLLGTNSHLNMILNNSDALNLVFGSAKASELFFNNGNAVNELSSKELAVSLMMQSTNALKELVDSQEALAIFNSSASKLALVNQFINQTGYKLKRQVFTTSGTLTYSDTIVKCNEFGVGDGGNGSTVSVGGQAGQGGGGGEVVCKTKISSFIPTSSAVSISDGNNTTVGTTLFVATKGTTGDNDPLVSGTGGGSDTGSNVDLFLPNSICLDPTLAIWYPGNWTVKGGDGGNGSPNDGLPASSLLGTGGEWVSHNSGGIASTGYGSGGAGGGYSGGGTNYPGTDAGGYGCGGNSSNRGGSGGAGSNGLFVFTYII